MPQLSPHSLLLIIFVFYMLFMVLTLSGTTSLVKVRPFSFTSLKPRPKIYYSYL